MVCQGGVQQRQGRYPWVAMGTSATFPLRRLLQGRFLLVAAIVLLGLINAAFMAAAHWWHSDSIPMSMPIAPEQRIDVIVWLRVPNMYGRYDQAHIHRLPGPMTITIMYQPAAAATMRDLATLCLPPWLPLAIACTMACVALGLCFPCLLSVNSDHERKQR